MSAGFVFRSPWYDRVREGIDLRAPQALRPRLQMYDSAQFVKQLLRDPADSVRFGADDVWTYPVPATPSVTDSTRLRLATSKLVRTNLRKLYQPSHQRFYVVVVELFCDVPGLPRAGSHTELTMRFRMRRLNTSLTAKGRPARRVATQLVHALATSQGIETSGTAPDVRDVWWADVAWRRRFEAEFADDLAGIGAHTDVQEWLVGRPGRGRWRTVDDADDPVLEEEEEETLPMWRLPVRERDADCEAAGTRSLWFGVVPTFSDEHWLAPQPGGRPPLPEPKLDDHAIYEIECIASQPRPGCPPLRWVSTPTEPFRLADPMDPAGTKNRNVTITLPDLRRLAARAGEPQGPGGVRIVTPPDSQLMVNPFKGIPGSGAGRVGAGAAICTFAIELFFLVAFFLFLLFLPIVVLAFQLWWLLALRFCIPPSIGFQATADFIATGKLLADVGADVDMRAAFNISLGNDFTAFAPGDRTPDWVESLDSAKDPGGTPVLANDSSLTHAVLVATDPRDAVPDTPPPREESPADPLCPVPGP
ncbi:MAG: hypothetical protein QM779_01470 [Propionicimonas sp.]|uniref:hypothetical protein n=1 Tax=Propionicimonas sp. TaxID=1955623 RepID=UPI003D0C92AF